MSAIDKVIEIKQQISMLQHLLDSIIKPRTNSRIKHQN